VNAEALYSDAKRLKLKLDCEIVGMSQIKQRRLEKIEAYCHSGTKVGQYVPFYFCPRSIMLFILYRGNHPDLNYTEGQDPIVHLQGDLNAAIQWADKNKAPWAFSDGNAGASVASFFNTTADLGEVDWAAVANTDFRDAKVKEGKQAEFLLWDEFPWELVEAIGVRTASMMTSVQNAIKNAAHRPAVSVKPTWYY
jgi:hypothetical protein